MQLENQVLGLQKKMQHHLKQILLKKQMLKINRVKEAMKLLRIQQQRKKMLIIQLTHQLLPTQQIPPIANQIRHQTRKLIQITQPNLTIHHQQMMNKLLLSLKKLQIRPYQLVPYLHPLHHQKRAPSKKFPTSLSKGLAGNQLKTSAKRRK